MTKIYKKGNYLYVESDTISREELVANVLVAQSKIGSTIYFIYFNINKTDSLRVEFADLVDENNLPFVSQEVFKDFYTSLQSCQDVNVDILQPLTNAQLRAEDVDVNITNTAIETPDIIVVPSATIGTVTSGKRSVTFTNIGNSDVNILGQLIGRGLSISFSATQINATLGAFTYNSLSSRILILTLD